MPTLTEPARLAADAAAMLCEELRQAHCAAIDAGNPLARLLYLERIEPACALRDRLDEVARALGA